VLDVNCVVGCRFGTDCLCWTVTVLWDVGLKPIVCVGRNCAVACCCGKFGCVGRFLCCRMWVWKGLVVLDVNCDLGCGCGTDWCCWTLILLGH
jgi:hypothetical protein